MSAWMLFLALLVPMTSPLPNPGGAAGPVQIYELAPQAMPVPALKARAAMVIDLDANNPVYQLNPHAQLAPASLTKVITTLVALDAMHLDQVVTVPASINQLPWDSTRMGLRVGEQLTVRDLLYGLFLNSGNDAAITLAEAVTSRAAFVDRMNAKAAALGMTDSHFVNPIGLDDPAHFTSAADLAIAATVLIDRDPEVAAIASIPRITLPATATHHAYPLYNLNDLIRTYPGATGLKTGWTGKAGGCLIATATRDGRHLMVVVLGSPSVFKEAAALLDYGFGV
jgi:D-alanyl-D-alanine carboxypeptidase (penicillin-binding protein 5/6)